MVNISAKFDKTSRDKLDSGLPDSNEANPAVAVRVSAFGALSRIKLEQGAESGINYPVILPI